MSKKKSYFEKKTEENKVAQNVKSTRLEFAEEIAAFTPKQMKAKYDAYGIQWKMRDFYITYFVAISMGFLFTFMYNLSLVYSFITIVICTFAAPFFIMSQKKYEYEKGRFVDINIYMQQMSQVMIQKNRIITALSAVASVFPKGEMKDTIEKAYLKMGQADNVRTGEIEGLEVIEKSYGNKPLHTLHEFSMRLEDRGGDYSKELELLNKTRTHWRERIENYQKDLTTTMIASCIEYAIIMCVCGFIQHALPESLSTARFTMVQITEVITIALFAFLVLKLQRKRCENWFKEDNILNEKEAKEALEYLKTYNAKEKSKLSIRLGLIWGVAGLVIALLKKSIPIFVVMLIIEVVFLNLHSIIHAIIKNKVKKAIKSAFPIWLFDICLLIQKENITVAITKSISDAPYILKESLNELIEKLKENPNNSEIFFNYLSEYNIQGIRDTMCLMVSLNSGIGGDNQIQMEALVKSNTHMIDKEDQIEAKAKEAALARYYYYPLIPCAILMGCYFYSIVTKILTMVIEILGL